MELASILRIVAVLACPVGMGLLMWWMMKGMSGAQNNSTTAQLAPQTGWPRFAPNVRPWRPRSPRQPGSWSSQPNVTDNPRPRRRRMPK